MRPPSPCIATYGDWDRVSTAKIKDRYEPLPNFVPKREYRKEKKSKYTHEVRRPVNRYSLGEVIAMDTCQRPATATPVLKPRLEKVCVLSGVPTKPALIRTASRQNGVEGRCQQWDRPMTPRGLWLYKEVKPETHFTGKREVKPVRVSSQVQAVKEYVNSPRTEAVIPPVTEYISTDGKDVIATINAAIDGPDSLPAVPPLPIDNQPDPQSDPQPDLPVAEPNPPSLEERIQELQAKAASLAAGIAKRSEYQAEFTAANSLIGRVASFKPASSHVSYFL